ncbi:sulfotransferase family 2 domain-containing protein [Acetobacter oeni]|uniref:Chondroitin 4-O-sulfotransferase n=1 Tax=Acetobacter oeni TaxID=304077 RepID=A0A511XHQ2_9PROT|nr:sulfotransferase family 2 domain-containing protein [Acetobacter oeni]MBB3882591.1 hypothetical protein [Acetobacter oeni]NHO18600.1 chondroitin 4-O-sulfotransferase [Acetobacter oeni]GBR12063.1 hypothetical protein AA21952_3534 [Acetobacter oeni LMG 21952]GEN62474.1 hypothetical protein AOE01nite_06980 [Acetobacter oeni]
MIILEEDRTIILHTPKCAGKVLREAFFDIASKHPFWNWNYLRSTGEWTDRAHMPLSVMRQTPEWENIRTYTLIAVVREPGTRFASSLSEHMRQHRKKDAMAVLKELDETRICHDPRYIHFIPQNRFTHIGNKRYADFIVRMENLPDDLRAVGTLCQFSRKFFDAVDQIALAPQKQEEDQDPKVSKKISDILTRFYLRDYALFGYDRTALSDQTPLGFDGLLTDPLCRQEWRGYRAMEPAYERFTRNIEQDFLLRQMMAENKALKAERDKAA